MDGTPGCGPVDAGLGPELLCSLDRAAQIDPTLVENDLRQLRAAPTGTVADRDVYYPGTEELAPDEMRVIACGTGMPNARPKQAAACWLVELV